MFRIVLSGRFTVFAPDGAEITPKGGKTQGLLALLATSPDLCRSRRWLEDKLWSNRGETQASGSLRQALSEIRRALGGGADALFADRQKVGLLRDAVTVEISATGEPEFLEGIDVRDPEFETWLRSERHRQMSMVPLKAAALVPPPVTAAPVLAVPPVRRPKGRTYVIVLEKARTAADSLSLLEEMFIDCVALSLREALGLTVFTRRPKPELPNTILVSVQAMVAGNGERHLRARAVELETDRLLWSGNSGGMRGFAGPNDLEVALFANQVVEVLGDAVTLQADGGAVLDSLVLQRMAVRKLWTMNAARMAEADALLTMADDLMPRGLNLARRAQLRVLQLIERHDGDRQALREEAMACCAQAMEREPNNSMVLAVVAYARSALDSTPLYAAELARRSVRLNPNNPLAWDSLSYAKLYSGDIAEAHQIALKVQAIGSAAPNKFWWDMGLCLTAALVHDDALALRMAQIAAAEAPDFRAAHRHVVALGAVMDQPEVALAAAERMKTLEDGFSLDRLANDPTYPVGLLRRAGLLQSDKISSLSG